jgi:hypothetical protein
VSRRVDARSEARENHETTAHELGSHFGGECAPFVRRAARAYDCDAGTAEDHYSTVSPIEQRESIGRVLRLVRTDAPLAAEETGAASGAEGGPSGAESREAVG